MFEFVRSHTRLFQFILVLLIFPSFVLFGLHQYGGSNDAASTAVAKVDGRPITQAEWDAAHRNQVERMRAQSPTVDVKLFDTPEMKRQTLEALVRERVMQTAALKLGFGASDERVKRLFASDPQLAFLRKPDGSLNTELLASQGISPSQFEQQLRQDLAMRQVLVGVGGTATAPAAAASAAIDALLQQRQVHVLRFESKNYLDQVKPTDAEVEAYYKDPAHAAAFAAPERASIDYVVLNLDALKSTITVSDDALRKYYAENAARYTTPEERRASHILVKAEAGAPAAEREKAKAKADALLAALKADPGKFAELAKKNSDDPGSAANGGDLDFFGRGAMVKPFEDAAFALAPGQMSDVVQSDFGFHIIKLTDKRGGQTRSFEEAKPEIEAAVKQQLAQQKFSEVAETFTNTVYEQPDSLQPVADKLKLQVRHVDAVTRRPAQGAEGPLANQKFLDAVFSTDSLSNKRNTAAIETGSNELAAARVTDYAPARTLPFAEVKDVVRERVVAHAAAALARKDAQARLAAWKGGAAPTADLLGPELLVSRNQTRSLPPELIDAVMKAPARPLPSWTGVDFGDQGYALVRIDKLLPRDPATGDAKQLRSQYTQVWAAAEAEAYYLGLKDRYKAKLTDAASTVAPPEGGAASATPR